MLCRGRVRRMWTAQFVSNLVRRCGGGPGGYYMVAIGLRIPSQTISTIL
jgi:hypothetical protein